MPVTREGPDLHGLVTVLSTHSVPAKPLTHGQPGGWEWQSSKEYVTSLAASILTRIFTSQRSSTNRIGSLEHDPSPRLGRAIAKCWPGCAPSESWPHGAPISPPLAPWFLPIAPVSNPPPAVTSSCMTRSQIS